MLNDQTLELLEGHLDGQLDDMQAILLQKHLADEPETAAEMQRLENARKLRMAAWQSLEQPGFNADLLLAKIQAHEQRQAWYMQILDHREKIAAVAACIAVFLIGWQWGLNAGAYHVRNGNTTNAQPVSLITQQEMPVAGQKPVYVVQVKDSTGNAVQQRQFATLEEAQRFISEIQLQLQTH